MYLKQIAEAVDTLGYEAMLIGMGAKQDPWVIASARMPSTKRLKFLIAHRPTLLPPALAARMTATFDHLSEGRVLLNVVGGGGWLDGSGRVFSDHDARYIHADEYLTIWRALIRGESVFPLMPTASNESIFNAQGNAADRERDLLMLPRTGSGAENLSELVK